MLAPQLKSTLQKFAKPWYKLRVIQIFCDQTNLTANPNLWGAIEKNLDDSEYFIYLASPKAAQSKWVKKEILYFHSKGRADNIIIVLTDGGLVWNDETPGFDWSRTDALPDLDDISFKEEPTWLDMTWIRKEQLTVRDPRFLDTIANLSAALRNIDKDILIGKDVEEHRKAKRFRILSVSGLVCLAIFLLAATFFAVRSENRSRERLVRTFIGNGTASLENKDYIIAFPWFVHAMINERNNDRKELSRFRVENLYFQMPELVQVWKTELPVLTMDFVSNSNILIVSGHAASSLTNEFHCMDSGKGGCRAEIKLVNGETGNDVYNPVLIKDGIRTMALSADKKLFASLSVGRKLRLWNVKDGKLIWEKAVKLPVSEYGFYCEINFNRQGTKLLFSYPVNDTRSRMDVYDVSGETVIAAHDEPLYGIINSRFLGDSDSLIYLSDGKMKIWNIKRDKVTLRKTPYLDKISRFELSPDDKHLAMSGYKVFNDARGYGSSAIIIYASIDSLQRSIFTKEYDNTPNKLEFDAQGKILGANSSTTTEANSMDDGTRVWDVTNGNPLTSWLNLSQEVDFGFDKGGKRIILSCFDGTTGIWEVAEGGSYSGNSNRLWLLHDGNESAKSVFSPDGRFILTSGQVTKLWKVPHEEAIQFIADGQGYPDESTDTSALWEVSHGVPGSDSTEVYITDKKSGIKKGTLKHDREVFVTRFSRDGNRIAVVTLNGIYVWQIDNQQQLFSIPDPPYAGVKSISFSLDDKKIVTALTDFSLRVWDARTGVPISPYMRHPFNLSYADELWAKFSKDDKKVLSIDLHSDAMIWDAVTGDPLSAPFMLDQSADEDTIAKRKQANQKNRSASAISNLSPEEWKNYAELISNRQMDTGGYFAPISNQAYLEKWKKWKQVFKR